MRFARWSLVSCVLAAPAWAQSDPPAPDIEPALAAPLWGREGTHWMTFSSAIAYDFDDSTDANVGARYAWFVVDDVEVGIDLIGWAFDQEGDDALGISPGLNFRWHFFNNGAWSVYADAGIGLLLSTDDVPEGGTSFNFNPHAGAGATVGLTEGGTRLDFGLRWNHISNAHIEGDASNPARDAPMLYAGIVVPW